MFNNFVLHLACSMHSVCVFKCITAGKLGTLSALCCTELLVLMNSFMEQRLRARACHGNENSSFLEKTNVKDVAGTICNY